MLPGSAGLCRHPLSVCADDALQEADAAPPEAEGSDGVDAPESSWMDDVAEAERDYVPTALTDRAFVETSEFPIEPFSLEAEREV